MRACPLHLSALMQGDRGGYVEDTSVPDGCVVAPGARFTKTWTAQNLGQAQWAGRRLVCWDDQLEVQAMGLAGEPTHEPVQRLIPDVTSVDLGWVQEGDVFEATVAFTAPLRPGPAVSYWLGVEADGTPFYSESAGGPLIVHVVPDAHHRAASPGVLDEGADLPRQQGGFRA